MTSASRTPCISAVVPAYNAARTVSATIETLLNQSLPAADIVVVDDGSRDSTREALLPYADRARLIFQQNSGVSAARNRGVREASGEWVAFCDADDLWHRDKLLVLNEAILANPDVDLVFHDFWTVVGDRVVETRATHSAGTMFPLFQEFDITIPRILTKHDTLTARGSSFQGVGTCKGSAFKWLMLGNFLMPSAVAVRKSVFESAGGFDPEFRYAEDTEFFLRFAKRARFLWLDAPLTGYRREAGTLLTGNMLPTIRNAARAIVKHCVEDEAVYRGTDSRWVRRAVSRRFTRLAYFCLSELRRDDARAYARDALGHRPLDPAAWGIVALSLFPDPALRLGRRLKTARRMGVGVDS